MRAEKFTMVDDVRSKLRGSPYLIVIEYTGMTVRHFAELRARLSGAGSQVHVVKNTFLRIAARDLQMPDLGECLAGQNAMVTGESDVCAAAKILKTFAAEFEKPVVKTGILDNSRIEPAQIKALAELPSRESLQATLLGVLLAPASRLVRVLNEPGASLARLLKAKLDASGSAPEPAP